MAPSLRFKSWRREYRFPKEITAAEFRPIRHLPSPHPTLTVRMVLETVTRM